MKKDEMDVFDNRKTRIKSKMPNSLFADVAAFMRTSKAVIKALFPEASQPGIHQP
ncbi:MAG: hypothetical protein ACOCTO_02605 [Marinilabiliaceae bacterium]